MAARILKDNSSVLSDSPQPIAESPESLHPGQHPSIVNVPVTPGIHLGEYASTSPDDHGRPATSYFSHNITSLREVMSPSETGTAQSDQEILRKISQGGGRARSESIVDLDPKSANPALGLSGGIISATFCIPHSLQHRKGQEWVGQLSSKRLFCSNGLSGFKLTAGYICTLRLIHTSCIKQKPLESYVGWLDWGNRSYRGSYATRYSSYDYHYLSNAPIEQILRTNTIR